MGTGCGRNLRQLLPRTCGLFLRQIIGSQLGSGRQSGPGGAELAPDWPASDARVHMSFRRHRRPSRGSLVGVSTRDGRSRRVRNTWQSRICTLCLGLRGLSVAPTCQVRDPGGTWHHLGGQSVARPAVREEASLLKRSFDIILQAINPPPGGSATAGVGAGGGGGTPAAGASRRSLSQSQRASGDSQEVRGVTRCDEVWREAIITPHSSIVDHPQ